METFHEILDNLGSIGRVIVLILLAIICLFGDDWGKRERRHRDYNNTDETITDYHNDSDDGGDSDDGD